MALTDKELQDIIYNLSEEEQKIILEKLKNKFDDNKQNKQTDKPIKKYNTQINNCAYCGSNNYKKHGTTASGMQRYICKDCGKTFSENNGIPMICDKFLIVCISIFPLYVHL